MRQRKCCSSILFSKWPHKLPLGKLTASAINVNLLRWCLDYINTFGRRPMAEEVGHADWIQRHLSFVCFRILRLTTFMWMSCFLHTWRIDTPPSNNAQSHSLNKQHLSSVSPSDHSHVSAHPLLVCAPGEQKLHLAPRSAAAGSDSAAGFTWLLLSVMTWLFFFFLCCCCCCFVLPRAV